MDTTCLFAAPPPRLRSAARTWPPSERSHARAARSACMWVLEKLQHQPGSTQSTQLPADASVETVFLLVGSPVVLGRPVKKGAPDADIVLADDSSVSKSHASLEIVPSAAAAAMASGSWAEGVDGEGGNSCSLQVTDLSRFGTFKNGVKLPFSQPTALHVGDVLKLGTKSLLRVRRQPVLVALPRLPPGPDQDIAMRATAAGLALPPCTWGRGVTHVLQPEAGPPSSCLALGLMAGLTLVSPGWLQQLLSKRVWETELPDPSPHHPQRVSLNCPLTHTARLQALPSRPPAPISLARLKLAWQQGLQAEDPALASLLDLLGASCCPAPGGAQVLLCRTRDPTPPPPPSSAAAGDAALLAVEDLLAAVITGDPQRLGLPAEVLDPPSPHQTLPAATPAPDLISPARQPRGGLQASGGSPASDLDLTQELAEDVSPGGVMGRPGMHCPPGAHTRGEGSGQGEGVGPLQRSGGLIQAMEKAGWGGMAGQPGHLQGHQASQPPLTPGSRLQLVGSAGDHVFGAVPHLQPLRLSMPPPATQRQRHSTGVATAAALEVGVPLANGRHRSSRDPGGGATSQAVTAPVQLPAPEEEARAAPAPNVVTRELLAQGTATTGIVASGGSSGGLNYKRFRKVSAEAGIQDWEAPFVLELLPAEQIRAGAGENPVASLAPADARHAANGSDRAPVSTSKRRR
ncbi:hypothetical protein V8C86DRAFT_2747479 [Haematococcus lacustris]